jgi:uncharacterized protein YprB with RNaseH-like and TPR domain
VVLVAESEDLRKRLKELNRQPLPTQKRSAAEVSEIRRRIRRMHSERATPERIRYSRDLPRAEAPAQRPRRACGPPVALEEAVGGVEVFAPQGERACLVVSPLDGGGEEWAGLSAELPRRLGEAASGLRRRIRQACGTEELRPEDLLFFDLETTGLAGTPLFLIGTMLWEEGGLVVRQYFARDYSEERAVIALFLGLAQRKRLLISFNGKSFDLPYVRVRAAASGLAFSIDLPHFDLLHECRRIWGRVLPDCRLQTLESCICGRIRQSDIPGSQIPEAYHEFVRTGNAAEIAEILRHNAFDLATLADLMARLPPPGGA